LARVATNQNADVVVNQTNVEAVNLSYVNAMSVNANIDVDLGSRLYKCAPGVNDDGGGESCPTDSAHPSEEPRNYGDHVQLAG